MPSDPTRAGGPRYTRAQRRLLTASAGLVVAALAAGAYVLTYDALRELALAGGAGRRWAPLYPAMADTLVTLTILSLAVTRGARWWTRLLRWSLLLLLVAGGAALSVQHSVWGHASLPGDAVRAGVAVAPHVMLVIAVWLWLTMFKQIRVARPATEETPHVDQRGHVRVLEPTPPPPALQAPEDEQPLIPFPDDDPAPPTPGPEWPASVSDAHTRPVMAALGPADPEGSAHLTAEHPRAPHSAEPGTGGPDGRPAGPADAETAPVFEAREHGVPEPEGRHDDTAEWPGTGIPATRVTPEDDAAPAWRAGRTDVEEAARPETQEDHDRPDGTDAPESEEGAPARSPGRAGVEERPGDAESVNPPAGDGADEWWVSATRRESGAADVQEAGGYEGASSEPAPPLDPLPEPRPAPDRAPALLPTDVELVRSRPGDEAEERPAASDTRPDIIMPRRALDDEEHDTPPPDRAEDPDAEDRNPPPSGNFRSGPTPPAE